MLPTFEALQETIAQFRNQFIEVYHRNPDDYNEVFLLFCMDRIGHRVIAGVDQTINALAARVTNLKNAE